MEQAEFERRPGRLAQKLLEMLENPDVLATIAHAIGQHAIPDAAARLADVVETALTSNTAAGKIAAREITS